MFSLIYVGHTYGEVRKKNTRASIISENEPNQFSEKGVHPKQLKCTENKEKYAEK